MAETFETIPTDHANFASAEASISADPTAGDHYHFGLEAGASAQSTTTINVSNANGVTLDFYTLDTGDRYYDQSGWATSMAAAEGTGGRVESGGSFCFDVRTPNVLIRYLELSSTSTALRLKSGCDAFEAHHLMIHGNQALYDQGMGVTATAKVYYVAGYDLTNANSFWAREAIVDVGHMSINGGTTRGFRSSGTATMTCDQCISVGSSPSDFATGVGGDYNVSSGTFVPGSNSWASVSEATIYESVAAGSEDLRMPSGELGTYTAPNDTATWGTLDIENNTVPGSGDVVVGCYQGAGGGGATTAPWYAYTQMGAH